jgi:hypothetical protein
MVDRTNLQAAHAAVIELQNTVAHLESTLERSSASVTKAEEILSSAAAMALMEMPSRLQELKTGKTLTPLASVHRVTRFQAEEELQLAQQAHVALESELKVAKIKLGFAIDARYWAAIAVTYATAAPLVAELQTLNLRRHQLRWTLNGVVNHRVEKNKPSDLSQPAGIHDALTDIAPNISIPVQAMSDRWGKRVEALTEDPATEIDVPPAVTAEDARFHPVDRRFLGYTVL